MVVLRCDIGRETGDMERSLLMDGCGTLTADVTADANAIPIPFAQRNDISIAAIGMLPPE